MPIFKIAIKCQLDGVTELEASSEDFQYQLKLRCNSCNEVSEKWQYVSADESIDIPSSRGTCNYLAKCKLCHRANTLDVCLQHQAKYCIEDVPNFKPIIAFECRGMSVCNFQFGGDWKCKSEKNRTIFENILLDEDWCDYDEDANVPVGITELEFKIV